MPRPRRTPPRSPSDSPPGAADFVARLESEVVQPFTRLSRLTVVAFPLDWPSVRGPATPPLNPKHPECADLENTTPCRESWDRDVCSMRQRPEVHWHRCPFGKWCALVPAVFKGRCIAAGKLVGYRDLSEHEFAGMVDHLDVLTQGFMRREAAWVAELMGEPPPGEPSGAAATVDPGLAVPRLAADSLIGRVLRHVHENLIRPDLTVKNVADLFGHNADYLAHLFSRKVGVRMSWFIAALRMERAGKLLTSGRERVNQIAPQVGYTNPAAFTQAFHVYTGLAPGEYRRRQRASGGRTPL